MKNKNILVVDDMPDWRDQLASTLKRDGYSVTTVAGYGEALGELRRSEYQLVIVDLRLSQADQSNRDGMILLDDLSALKIPAVVITGYGTTELARKAYGDYAVLDFIEKNNFDLKKFREVVKAAFRKAEEMEKELSDLRAKFMRGEIVKFPEDRLVNVLRDKQAKYGKENQGDDR
jgi:DNA-binding NtrC family response regulator